MPAISKKYSIIISIALISAVVFVAFSSCLRFDFVNWDDDRNVTENTAIRSISPASLRSIYTSFSAGPYEPLKVTVYALQYHYVKLRPFLYHFVNLAGHVLNCLLVFWLFFLISGRIPFSLLVAFLFGIHPLQVETVAWVSETKNVLYAFFYLWALICYVYYLRSDLSTKYLLYTFALFLLSLLSKSMAVTLPAVMILFDIYLGRKVTKRLIFHKIPFLALALIFAFIAIRGIGLAGCIREESWSNIFYKAGVACYSVAFYVGKIFIPVNLSCFYEYSLNREDYYSAMFFYSYLFFLSGCGLLYIFRRHAKKIAFGLLFFLFTLLPALQFVPVGGMLVADHYVYLPLLGCMYIAAEGAFWLYGKTCHIPAVRSALAAGTVFIIVMFAVSSWHRCQAWRNSVSLWTDVIAHYPDTATAYNNRGTALLENRQYDLAREDCLKALRLDPLFAEAYVNLSGIYRAAGNTEESARFLNKAIEANPGYLRAYDYLVIVNQELRRNEEVIKICRKEIQIDPRHALAYSNLAAALGASGDIRGAIEQSQKAISLEPNLASAHFTIAVAYYNANLFDLALRHCDMAVSLGFEVPTGFMRSLDPHRKGK
jgi:protein O-mannosyl-transferase